MADNRLTFESTSVSSAHTLAITVNGVPNTTCTRQRRRSRLTVDVLRDAEDEDNLPLLSVPLKRTRCSTTTQQSKRHGTRVLRSSSSDSESSSSSSSSSSDSSSTSSVSSGSEHVTIGGKLVRVQPRPRARPKSRLKNDSVKPNSSTAVSSTKSKTKKLSEENEDSVTVTSDDDDQSTSGYQSVISSRMAQRDAKQRLVAKLLCRWWYVLDPWPPASFSPNEELCRRKLKLVPLDQWEGADDVDDEGFTKVYAISHYPGVYRDPQGNAIDIRPLKGKPCYATFKNYSEFELSTLLLKALTNQLAAVDSSPYSNTEQNALCRLKRELETEIKNTQDLISRLQREKPASNSDVDAESFENGCSRTDYRSNSSKDNSKV